MIWVSHLFLVLPWASLLFPILSLLFPIPSLLFPIPSLLFPIPSLLFSIFSSQTFPPPSLSYLSPFAPDADSASGEDEGPPEKTAQEISFMNQVVQPDCRPVLQYSIVSHYNSVVCESSVVCTKKCVCILFITCTSHVHHMCITCASHVHHMLIILFITCTSHAHSSCPRLLCVL